MRKEALGVVGFCLGLFLCAWPEIAAAQPRITKAVLGTGATAKYEIVNPTTEFAPDTPKIFCAWRAEGVKTGTPVRGVWIAEDVGKVAPPNYKVDETTLNLPFANEGTFALSKPNKGFPPGKYRLEIYLGKDLAKTLPFTVRAK
jgi:hypothetical protein